MMLFVRAPYCHMLRDGQKTIEVRWGPRYRKITTGSVLSINGRDRVRVTSVERASAREASRRYHEIGCTSGREFLRALRSMGYRGGPLYLFHVRPL